MTEQDNLPPADDDDVEGHSVKQGRRPKHERRPKMGNALPEDSDDGDVEGHQFKQGRRPKQGN